MIEQQDLFATSAEKGSNDMAKNMKWILDIRNTLLQTSRVREFRNAHDLAEAAFWTLRDTTHLDKASATLAANALMVPGVSIIYAPVTLTSAVEPW